NARSRERAHLGVGRRDQQIDALAGDHAAQRPGVAGMRQRWHEVIAVGRRLLEQETVAVTADDRERPVAGAKAADQVARGGASRAGGEQTPLPERGALTAISRRRNARRIVSAERPR